MRKFDIFKTVKTMLSNPSIAKLENSPICENSLYSSNFTLASMVYTTIIIGIMEISGKFYIPTRTPYQPRDKYNVQTQIILSCKLDFIQECKPLTPCHSNALFILD